MLRVLVVCLPIFALSSLVFAAQSKVTGAEIAEHIFFTSMNSKNLLEMTESSDLEPKQKQEAIDYLHLHHLEKKSVGTKWSEGSSFIELTDGSSILNLDFTDLALDKTVKINGIRVDAASLTHFSDVVTRFQAVTHRKNAFSNLVFSEANAAADDPGSAAASFFYWSGLEELTSCVVGEDITRAHCVFKDNAKMIMSSVGRYAVIKELNCSSKGFKSGTVMFRYGPIELTSARDQAGKLTSLQLFESGTLACEYKLKAGAMTEVKNDTVTAAYCDGRAVGDYYGVSHNFHKNDQPNFVSDFPISLPRLDKCCLDSACRTELFAAIKQQPATRLHPLHPRRTRATQ